MAFNVNSLLFQYTKKTEGGLGIFYIHPWEMQLEQLTILKFLQAVISSCARVCKRNHACRVSAVGFCWWTGKWPQKRTIGVWIYKKSLHIFLCLANWCDGFWLIARQVYSSVEKFGHICFLKFAFNTAVQVATQLLNK